MDEGFGIVVSQVFKLLVKCSDILLDWPGALSVHGVSFAKLRIGELLAVGYRDNSQWLSK